MNKNCTRIIGQTLAMLRLSIAAAGFALMTVFAVVAHAETPVVSEVQAVAVATQQAESQQTQTAHQVVEDITVDLLALIKGAQEYVDEDEARFFNELESLLRPFVDFRSFARAVMGRHASGKKMAALDEPGRKNLDDQIDRFSEVFSAALIQTYGKGLLAFEGERIEVVPVAEGANTDTKKTTARVKQLIYGERQKPYEIQYSMRINDQQQWKLRNMVVESINLGKIYRNQFDNAFQVYDGDINRVIENWVVAVGSDAAADS